MAIRGEFRYLAHDLADWHRTAVAAAKGNNAESAAMVAALLDLNESTCPVAESVQQVARGFPHGHDVVDHNRNLGHIAFALHLLDVAENSVDFWHCGESVRIDLRRASGDDDLRAGAFTPCLTDRLTGLSFGFRRHGAGIDDDDIGAAGGLCMIANDL